jgi:hypothetical protein
VREIDLDEYIRGLSRGNGGGDGGGDGRRET